MLPHPNAAFFRLPPPTDTAVSKPWFLGSSPFPLFFFSDGRNSTTILKIYALIPQILMHLRVNKLFKFYFQTFARFCARFPAEALEPLHNLEPFPGVPTELMAPKVLADSQ